MQFNAIIEKDDHGYFVFVPNLKGCVSQGDTMEEALLNIKEAIELYIETLEPDELTSMASQDYLIAPVEIDIAHA
jgi:predicted RNase H-like HicB family nuclease